MVHLSKAGGWLVDGWMVFRVAHRGNHTVTEEASQHRTIAGTGDRTHDLDAAVLTIMASTMFFTYKPVESSSSSLRGV